MGFSFDGYLADSGHRLINIVGPGGMGKSRLALAIARAALEAGHFPDGVFFVPLAPLAASEQIIPAIAKALQHPLQHSGQESHRSESQQVFDFLSTKRTLLILDNLEHLTGSASLIDNLLSAAASTTIIVTSRERLGLPGEQVIPLHGLTYSVEGMPTEPEKLNATQLFVETARRQRPDFDANAEELEAIVRICRFVEGMPLAIELAAAWVDTLTPDEI